MLNLVNGPQTNGNGRGFWLTFLVVLAMAVYFGTAFLIGGADLGMIRRNVRRKPAADMPPAAEE